ncbi:MAG: hypothetical protein IPL27_24405 [Lewinellaceae bacterium]|nr:hypothetical protein [Lewinellaceae bacterium]
MSVTEANQRRQWRLSRRRGGPSAGDTPPRDRAPARAARPRREDVCPCAVGLAAHFACCGTPGGGVCFPPPVHFSIVSFGGHPVRRFSGSLPRPVRPRFAPPPVRLTCTPWGGPGVGADLFVSHQPSFYITTNWALPGISDLAGGLLPPALPARAV